MVADGALDGANGGGGPSDLAPCEPDESVEVDVRLDQPGQPLPERGGVAPLDRGHQPQIPLGECDAWVVVRERTQRSSRAGAGHRVGEPLAMGRATCTVEDNAGQRQMRIEPLEAERSEEHM